MSKPTLADLTDHDITWTMAAGDERRTFTLRVPVASAVDPGRAAYVLGYAVNEISGCIWKITEDYSVMPAADLTDRQLLAAVHRWARTNGWTVSSIRGWINASCSKDATLAIGWDATALLIYRRQDTPPHYWPMYAETYPARSVREAVDILCALRILPGHLSSQAGEAARLLALCERSRQKLQADLDEQAQIVARLTNEVDDLRVEIQQQRTQLAALGHLRAAAGLVVQAWQTEADTGKDGRATTALAEAGLVDAVNGVADGAR